MQLTTIRLRNYRVFAELDLELPAGLVGIYGPNGSGKSSLLESIMWALYGRSRTAKGDIRTSGVTEECSVEIGFAHDGHHYLVRRSLTGVNSTVKARMNAGSQVVADGPTEVGRFVRATLGMDEAAFRSSVFAEQKQLTAFSDNTPEQRRRLILQLLGITPIEKARDAARADARARRGDHERLLALLPVLTELEAKVDPARSTAARTAADEGLAEAARLAAEASAEALAERLRRSEADRSAFELIRSKGQAVRAERDRATLAVGRLEQETVGLRADGERLAVLARVDPETIGSLEVRIASLERHEEAIRVRTRLRLDTPDRTAAGDAVAEPDPAPLEASRAAADLAATRSAVSRAAVAEGEAALLRAGAAAKRADQLDATGDCPLCGQALGEGFVAVRAHHAHDLDAATAELRVRRAEAAVADAELTQCRKAFAVAQQDLEAKQGAFRAGLERRAAISSANDAVERSVAALGGPPEAGELDDRRVALQAQRGMVAERARIEGRVERLRAAEAELAGELANVESADAQRTSLLKALAELGFDPQAHARLIDETATAQAGRGERVASAAQATRAALAADHALRTLEALLEQGRAQHERADALAQESRYLGRAAEMLHGFRQVIVGMVGPRLSVEASALFNELTAGEYDGLEIDPETYEIRIIDAGAAYPSERFSGSEVDLANLALRVAVSEQVRFQAGGQVGLLVLDEALASLDVDRKDRMLAALTQLGGRFRQILVVTHAPEVKERLPAAIEVLKLPGRRATVRVIDALGPG